MRGLNLPEIAKEFESKLKNIKMCLFDVDGILTNAQVYWDGEECGFNRAFHIQDGYGMKTLMRAGIKVGIITGGNSKGVQKRFDYLGVDYLYMGNEDKRQAFQEIVDDSGIDKEHILYMGDEFFDLPILKQVGFSATVPSASYEIRTACDYITHREAGMGCAREVMDLVRHAQDILPVIKY